MAADPQTIVFIGGLHRSGTSLLTRCLAQHPATSSFRDTGVPEDEGQHLQDVYLPAYRHGGPGRFGFSRSAHLTESSPLATPANASRLIEQWSRHWDMDRTVLLEKSPPNLIRARFLQALFPASRFVFLLRHPVAVTLATQKWSRTSSASLLRHWLVAHRTMAIDRPFLKHNLLVYYEDFVLDPQTTVDKVTDWLHLSRTTITEPVAANSNEAYFCQWRSRRVALSGLALRFLEVLYEKKLGRWGYSFTQVRHSVR